MSVFTFVAVIVIASLLVGAFNEYQKNKLRFQGSNKQLGELKDEIKSMKKRIENLEIIAVSDPDNFQDRARNIRMDEEVPDDSTESNQRLVNELARKKQGVK
jgi:type VI protein secretion system component VasK